MRRNRKRAPNSSDRLKKAQLSFYPEPEDYEALKALSARTGVPQQVYLRRGLAYILRSNDATSIGAAVAAARGRTHAAVAQYRELAEEWNDRLRRTRGNSGRRKP
jgi:ribosomal 50S subunit-associated protein YjgA (DUF615 family)